MATQLEMNVMIPMRDGVSLATNIWRPQDGAGPVLLLRTPYGKDTMTIVYGAWGHPLIMPLLAAGYSIAMQDCRGTFASEGTFLPHRNDPDDGEDTVAWLLEQEWCDGNVGTYGASYLGFVQWQLAVTGAPGLKAIAPLITSADLYRNPWYSSGGAMSLSVALGWPTTMSSLDSIRAVAQGSGSIEEATTLAAAMADPSASTWATPVADQPALAKSAPWFQDIVGHAARDDFWQQRELASLDRAEEITVPALSIGGWYDLFIGETLRGYTTMRKRGGSEAARSGQRLIVGPWSHTNLTGVFPDRSFGLSSNVDAAMLTPTYVAFFDRWLRGREAALDGMAAVRIFVMGIDQWRDEQDWPLPDTDYADHYLAGSGRAKTVAGDGQLVASKPEDAAVDRYLFDPRRPVPSIGGNDINTLGFNGPADQRPVESRDDVLVYSSGVLQEALEVTGPISLTLYVSSSAVDTDFTGKLVDVHPDGRAILLCEGIQRMRYRDSLSQPEMMLPGEVYEITLDLGATANVFLPGHQLRLEVSSSNFPRYDRNSNTGGAISSELEADMVTAINYVHHGPEHPSRLTLPVINR